MGYRSGLPKLVTKMGFGRLRIQSYQNWLWWVKDSKFPKCVTEEGYRSGLWWVKDSELPKWVTEMGSGKLRIESNHSWLWWVKDSKFPKCYRRGLPKWVMVG